MLWLIGLLHAFTHLYQVALLPLYLDIQRDLKLGSVEQATLLVTIMGVAYFVPSYGLGVLADRLSRKKLLAFGLAINGGGFVLLSFAQTYAWALASVVLAGLGGSFYHPSATALVARLFPQGRGQALGLVGIGASVGFFFGPFYSGWRAVSSMSWRNPVLELGLFGLVAAAAFAWLADEEQASLPTSPSAVAGPGRKEKLFPTLTLWIFFLLASLAFSLRDFAGSAMATSASLFLQNARHFDPKLAGFALSGIYIASVISNPILGRFSDGARLRWITYVLVLAATFISLFPRASLVWMVPTLLAYGFFFMASYPMTEAAVMESVHDSVRGRCFGLFITVGGLINNMAHWLVGKWVHNLDDKASIPASYLPLYGVLTALVLASLAGLPCLRAIKKREAELPIHDTLSQTGTLPSASAR
jgi:MFS family permease